MDVPILSYWTAVALLVLSVLGFALLIVALARSGARRARLARRPLPYPGCLDCAAANVSDLQGFTTGALERHENRYHFGPRWW